MPIINTGYQPKDFNHWFGVLKGDVKQLFPDMSEKDSNLLIVMLKTLADKFESLDQAGLKAYNNVYVNTAEGVHLDRAVKLAGITRLLGTKAVGTVTFVGAEGTAIPPHFLLETADGTRFETTNAGTILIPASGTLDSEVVAISAGQEAVVLAGTITKMVNPKSGLTSVTNAEATSGGTDRETDAALRSRYFEAMKSIKSSSLDGILSYVRTTTEATFVTGEENNTMTDHTGTGGLPPKSFRLTVDGGTDQEIADAIFFMKPSGIDTYGDTTVQVDYEGKTYDVHFTRAAINTVYFDLNLTVTPGSFGAEDLASIRAAIKEYADTETSLDPARLVGIIYGNSSGVLAVNSLKLDTAYPPVNTGVLTAAVGSKFTTTDDDIAFVY